MSGPRSVGGAALVAHATVADLTAESQYLARTLAQPRVLTPGVAGIVNALAPSAVWIYESIDIDAFLSEVGSHGSHLEVMVPAQAGAMTSALQDRGWHVVQTVDRLRCDLARRDVARQVLTTSDVEIRPARPADMARLRALHVEAFGSEDSADYLPDALLEVPVLQVFIATSPNGAEALVGSAGVRLRHRGAFVFGLATRPEQRHTGIATALVQRCLDWATGRRAPLAFADVDLPVPSFWYRLGFRSTSRWHRLIQGRPTRP